MFMYYALSYVPKEPELKFTMNFKVKCIFCVKFLFNLINVLFKSSTCELTCVGIFFIDLYRFYKIY